MPNDTKIVFWHYPADRNPRTKCSISDLPIKLSAEQFRGRGWNMDFRDPEDQLLFSLALSPDLFAQLREINVLLDAPIPQIDPRGFPDRDLRFTSNITKRMRYRVLPHWHETTQTFLPGKIPVMVVTNLDTKSTLHDASMEYGCGATTWWAFIDEDADIPDRSRLRFTVHYDSGGLFNDIVTTRDFRYSAERHSYWSHSINRVAAAISDRGPHTTWHAGPHQTVP
ncbi:hypothetical protein [Fuerstiella marisgermanici]|uniref:hypothetical protein n=1 Tax=Fuerstiella marisgermanici TaxID=1891926 RepID=UPI0011AB6836|nr:hypothetical protein [Fuerstiella marisgermanici]